MDDLTPESVAKNKKVRRLVHLFLGAGVGLVVIALIAVWLGVKATTIESELRQGTGLIPFLQKQVLDRDPKAVETVERLSAHTAKAHSAANDPLWVAAGSLPWVGANFRAAGDIALAADDLAKLGAKPLIEAAQDMELTALAPRDGSVNLNILTAAKPRIITGAYAVRQSSQRLNEIDADQLLDQISEPLVEARGKLNVFRTELDAVADAASVAPTMLGSSGERKYLLIIQNNSEVRASGGIPGALAILTLDQGRLALSSQTSAAELGVWSPPLPVDKEQEEIYTSRLGKFMQDVNLTPDFPTTATTARAMWESKTGELVDGVVSIDPVALGYLLEATGPISPDLSGPFTQEPYDLPSELNSKNVVTTLLSGVYTAIEQPELQDAYFSGVARKIFGAIAGGQGDAKAFFTGITRGTKEGRVLLWSSRPEEQIVISKYPLSGSVSGRSVAPAQFGVYFNDGTGAKMDFYVKRTVQLVKECPKDGYEETTVRITSLNTAPPDAATSLPTYVTGNGAFGIPPGSVQTNIVVYGPAQANVETAKVNNERTGFAPYLHGNRPVGVIATRLAPGEAKTVDVTFDRIVQHAEPNVVVTPTIQDVKDVALPTITARCD